MRRRVSHCISDSFTPFTAVDVLRRNRPDSRLVQTPSLTRACGLGMSPTPTPTLIPNPDPSPVVNPVRPGRISSIFYPTQKSMSPPRSSTWGHCDGVQATLTLARERALCSGTGFWRPRGLQEKPLRRGFHYRLRELLMDDALRWQPRASIPNSQVPTRTVLLLCQAGRGLGTTALTGPWPNHSSPGAGVEAYTLCCYSLIIGSST